MKVPRITCLLLCAVFSLAQMFAIDDSVKKDLAEMAGEWTLVSGSASGHPMPEPLVKGMKRICQGDEITTRMNGNLYFKAKITIDPSKAPKTIDYQMIEGFNKGEKQLGIYELSGGTFKSSFGAPGAERPTDFTTKPGDGRTLIVWKRVRAESGK
jgi:uncharacterized protein (TIGR03067 family)